MAEQIPRNDLIVGRTYVGRGRNGNVGLWNGKHFLVIGEKFGEVIKYETYYEEETGCFQPFAIVDEGVMVEPFGRVGWDAHYGRLMEFGRGVQTPAFAHLNDRKIDGPAQETGQ